KHVLVSQYLPTLLQDISLYIATEVFRQNFQRSFFVRMDTVHRLDLRSYVSPDNVAVLSSESSAGGYSRILKRETELGDISEDVQPFLLSDEARRRIENSALDFSRKQRSQSIRHASHLYNGGVFSRNQTDFVERVARHKVRSGTKAADSYRAPLELIGLFDLRQTHEPVVQGCRTCGDHDHI